MLSECRDALQAVREELKPDQVSPSPALGWVLRPPTSVLSCRVLPGVSTWPWAVCRCDELVSSRGLWALVIPLVILPSSSGLSWMCP